MQNKQRFTKFLRVFTLIAMVFSFMPWSIPGVFGVKSAEAAAVNLLTDGSFNQDINLNWYFWQGENSNREYRLMRGYQTPFGFGPYSMAISANGTSAYLNDAGIVSIDKNRFMVTQGVNYNFSFYVKASAPMTISLKLENAETFVSLTDDREVNVGTSWTRQQVALTPTQSGLASLSILVGNIPDGATLYFDAFNLFENNAAVITPKVSGYIGDLNRAVRLQNGNLFTLDEVRIELPYVNEQTGQVGVRQFPAKNLSNSTVYFDMPAQTFSGVGRILVGGNSIGTFDYQVMLRITEFSPNPVSVDEDLVVYGTGFSPDKEQSFVLVTALNAEGRTVEKWIKPHIIDDKLTQMVIKLPVGVTNGRLSVRNYYNDTSGNGVEMKSNQLGYNIKPVIYQLDWSRPGYEQIGDKITIYGKGIIHRPVVNFYDEEGKFVSSARGTIKEVNEAEGYEAIEVVTPLQLNKLKATVKIGVHESEKADALTYTARPILTSIRATASRKMAVSNAQIAAAKPGEKIRLIGRGFKNASEIYVEFPTLNGKMTKSYVPKDQVDPNGNWLDVVVPKEAQNGQINVEVNGQKSNQMPLEIIPHIISVTPLIPSPGEEMTFWTNGVGLDVEQTTVIFQLNNKEKVEVKPLSLVESGYGDVIVRVVAPKAIAGDSSNIKIKYGYWLNDQKYSLQTDPVIERAAMNTDTKILTINGYGFSNNPAENKITYKYADGTVVNPKVKMLGVYTTTEGQQIRVQILDTYYYGYVSVTVNGKTSNEVNIGPAVVTRIERRIQHVASENRVMGVLYISGRNFGPNGDVRVGDTWANTHYRTNTFIIAVVEQADLYKNPVIVTKAQ